MRCPKCYDCPACFSSLILQQELDPVDGVFYTYGCTSCKWQSELRAAKPDQLVLL